MNKQAQKQGEKQAEKQAEKQDLQQEEVNSKSSEYIDSAGGAESSIASILKIPVEDKTPSEDGESANDVLEGNDRGFEDAGDGNFGDDVENELFEDHTLMAEIGVEVIDMVMSYGAMAIAKDFDNEAKYSVSQSRKNKIKKPLELLLKNRETGVSPEMMVAFMVLATYTPVIISAVQERRKKAKESEVIKPILRKQSVDNNFGKEVKFPTKNESQVIDEVIEEEEKEVRPQGRPKGSEDIKKRKTFSKAEKAKMMLEAVKMKKKGDSYSTIAEKLDVSMSTAVNWVKLGSGIKKPSQGKAKTKNDGTSDKESTEK